MRAIDVSEHAQLLLDRDFAGNRDRDLPALAFGLLQTTDEQFVQIKTTLPGEPRKDAKPLDDLTVRIHPLEDPDSHDFRAGMDEYLSFLRA